MDRNADDEIPHRRKRVRLEGYDYRQPGSYFITICTEQRLPLLGEIVNGDMRPNDVGRMVKQVWASLAQSFRGISLDAMVLMPDHLHGIVTLGWDPDAPATPALGDVVRYFKGRSTTRYFAGVREQGWDPVPGRLWQQRYFDRIVRSQHELDAIRTYIEANPMRWWERRQQLG